jgi:hypothetical protein
MQESILIPGPELVDLDQEVLKQFDEEGDVHEVLVETSPSSYADSSTTSRHDISFPSQSPPLRSIGTYKQLSNLLLFYGLIETPFF